MELHALLYNLQCLQLSQGTQNIKVLWDSSYGASGSTLTCIGDEMAAQDVVKNWNKHMHTHRVAF